MTAPLKPNINDKGIAFGGTLASILALSGWALTDLVLREAGEAADVLIAVATTEYRAPVSGRIVARCPLPPPEDLADVSGRLSAAGEGPPEAGGVHRDQDRHRPRSSTPPTSPAAPAVTSAPAPERDLRPGRCTRGAGSTSQIFSAYSSTVRSIEK